jgi:hypothetical protein
MSQGLRPLVSDSIDGNKHHRYNEAKNSCEEQCLRAEIYISRRHVAFIIYA